MNNQEIQNELLQVRKEIEELPKGYISKKNINGKTRYYLQWNENGKKNAKTVFTQPGMRYAQAKEMIQSLLEDEMFQGLSIDERNTIIERILSDIKGRMMEDIILLETKIANPNKQVFQLQFAVGEFDMVIADTANASCEIYEVKHSKECVKEQYRHLIDNDKLTKTEFRYGKIMRKVVIYRGEDLILDNGIEYRNVEDYLKSLA